MRMIFVLVLLAAAPLHAQGLRAGDEPMDAAALSATLAGQVVEFFDGSLARYRADGAYDYRYRPEGREHRGTYTTTDDSTVCVAFENGFDRCDTYVRAAGRLVLIIEDGTRFPVRATHPIE